jgi:hypothetical protein
LNFSNSYNVKTSGFTTDKPIVQWTVKSSTTEIAKDTTADFYWGFPVSFSSASSYSVIGTSTTNNTSAHGASFTINIYTRALSYCYISVGNQAESKRTLTQVFGLAIGY